MNVYLHILTNFSSLFYFLLVHNNIKSGNTTSDVTLKKIQILEEEKLEKNTKIGAALYYSLGQKELVVALVINRNPVGWCKSQLQSHRFCAFADFYRLFC